MTKHILLIDDDPDEIDIFIDALRDVHADLRYTAVAGVEEALALLDHTVPDYILLDYNMPKINGLEGLVDIKRRPDLTKVPVLMYSATMDEDLMKIAVELGAAGCIRKPYDMRKLPLLLQPYLG